MRFLVFFYFKYKTAKNDFFVLYSKREHGGIKGRTTFIYSWKPFNRHERAYFCWENSSWLSKLLLFLSKVYFRKLVRNHETAFCEHGKKTRVVRNFLAFLAKKNPYREHWLDFWIMITHMRYFLILQYSLYDIFPHIWCCGGGPRLTRPRWGLAPV